jgi:hypothetical protein
MHYLNLSKFGSFCGLLRLGYCFDQMCAV